MHRKETEMRSLAPGDGIVRIMSVHSTPTRYGTAQHGTAPHSTPQPYCLFLTVITEFEKGVRLVGPLIFIIESASPVQI